MSLSISSPVLSLVSAGFYRSGVGGGTDSGITGGGGTRMIEAGSTPSRMPTGNASGLGIVSSSRTLAPTSYNCSDLQAFSLYLPPMPNASLFLLGWRWRGTRCRWRQRNSPGWLHASLQWSRLGLLATHFLSCLGRTLCRRPGFYLAWWGWWHPNNGCRLSSTGDLP